MWYLLKVPCVLFRARCAAEKRRCDRTRDRGHVERGHTCLHLWDKQHFTAGHTQHLCVSGCWWCRSYHVSDTSWFFFQLFDKVKQMCIKQTLGKATWERHTCHLFNTHILMQFVTCVIEKCIFSLGFNKLVSSCFHRERNNRYAEVCRNRMCNDKYVDRSMQTLNGPAKNKQIQSDCAVMVDTG